MRIFRRPESVFGTSGDDGDDGDNGECGGVGVRRGLVSEKYLTNDDCVRRVRVNGVTARVSGSRGRVPSLGITDRPRSKPGIEKMRVGAKELSLSLGTYSGLCHIGANRTFGGKS